jgi:hypothetical protein
VRREELRSPLRVLDAVVIAGVSALFGAGVASFVWAAAIPQGSDLWERLMHGGATCCTCAALLGAIWIIRLRAGRR